MGNGGICDLANSDQVIVDHSTVDVKTSKSCYEFARNKDVNFLDAPISGGRKLTDGTLTIMVGGKEEIFNKAKPTFEMMEKISHMGPSGAGTAKLVNQLLVSTNTVALALKHLFLQSKQV